MFMQRHRLAVLLAAITLACFLVRADGPHWQVPDPGPPYGYEEEHKRIVESLIQNVTINPGLSQGGSKNAPRDYYPNPSDFLVMDQIEIDFYQRHCRVRSSKSPVNLTGMNKREIYLYIMAKCAQAMREVDDYLPCHDSFPLWHSEAGRSLMEHFSIMTWVRATELPMEFQKPCLEYCVQAFIQVARFETTEAAKANRELKAQLEKANQDAGANGIARVPKGQLLTNTGFDFVTGDIPAVTDSAYSRMRTALIKMGSSVVPYLKEAAINANNERVTRELKAIYDAIVNQGKQPKGPAESVKRGPPPKSAQQETNEKILEGKPVTKPKEQLDDLGDE